MWPSWDLPHNPWGPTFGTSISKLCTSEKYTSNSEVGPMYKLPTKTKYLKYTCNNHRVSMLYRKSTPLLSHETMNRVKRQNNLRWYIVLHVSHSKRRTYQQAMLVILTDVCICQLRLFMGRHVLHVYFNTVTGHRVLNGQYVLL